VGQQDNTIPVALYNMANSMPLNVLEENYLDANGNEAVYSRFRNRTNPYFTLYKQFQKHQEGQDFWKYLNEIQLFCLGSLFRGD